MLLCALMLSFTGIAANEENAILTSVDGRQVFRIPDSQVPTLPRPAGGRADRAPPRRSQVAGLVRGDVRDGARGVAMPRPRVPRRRAPRGPGGPARGHRPPPPRAQPGSGAIDPAGSPREQHADVLVPGALPTGLLDEPSPHEPPHGLAISGMHDYLGLSRVR